MWPYHPELLATPVPRYTSYPTAADFDLLPSCHYRAELERTQGDVSLYLHIPFCEQICYYCGCNTGKANRRQRLDSYLAALHTEIETVAAALPQGVRVRRVAFGGGSPNAIRPDDFMRLVETLNHHFDLTDPVYSIELDPRTMTAGFGGGVVGHLIRGGGISVHGRIVGRLFRAGGDGERCGRGECYCELIHIRVPFLLVPRTYWPAVPTLSSLHPTSAADECAQILPQCGEPVHRRDE